MILDPESLDAVVDRLREAPRIEIRRAWGYIRVSTNKQVISPEVQMAKIQEAAIKNNCRLVGVFQDAPTRNLDGSFNDAQSGKVRLSKRKAGAELLAKLQKGDVVIIATGDRAFRKLSDMVLQLDAWERLGVAVLLCDFPMLCDLTNPFLKAFLQMSGVFHELEGRLVSIRTKESLACKKKKGQAVNRFPGYGFRFEKRYDSEAGKKVKVRVSDPDERSIMKQIVKWRIDTCPWEDIVANINDHGVLTKHGTKWSRSRVIRAFRAELRLQARENRSGER